MLNRLAGHLFYCFLDGYFRYTHISIAPEYKEKTTFACPFGAYCFKRMPFGFCNAPTTFQRCMISFLSYFVEQCMEIFMNDFSVFGSLLDDYFFNLSAEKIQGEKSAFELGEMLFHGKKRDSLRSY